MEPVPPVQEEPIPAVEKLTFPEIRYRLVQLYPGLWNCGPRIIRLGRLEKEAIQSFSDLQADLPAFQAMAKHLGLEKAAEFTEAQKVLLYSEYKKLQFTMRVEPQEGKLKFTLRSLDQPLKLEPGYNGHRITGLIDSKGNVSILESVPEVLSCPL